MKSSAASALLLWCCFLSLSAAPAFANNYCTGRGYIAFDALEGRPVVTPGLQSRHVLRVFRFGGVRGIYKAGDWPMRNSGISSMWCNGDHVVVSGPVGLIVGQGMVRDEIDIAESQNDSGAHIEDNGSGPFLTQEGDLGYSSQRAIDLDSSDAEHKYELVTSSTLKGVARTTKVELLQIDLNQKVSQRVLLYEERHEEWGD
jgi:hypothetical protein